MPNLRDILPVGSSVLREESEEITAFDGELHSLLDEMGSILYAEEGRAGLAAPQIGILKRVIVINGDQGYLELVNPTIIEKKGFISDYEGCLSLPGYYGEVTRFDFVKVEYFTREGKKTTIKARDFTSRCLQHEIDHLNGILYIDHIRKGRLFNDRNDKKSDLKELLKLSGK